jgi:hypothetical protein
MCNFPRCHPEVHIASLVVLVGDNLLLTFKETEAWPQLPLTFDSR